jgi:hypothetical protein
MQEFKLRARARAVRWDGTNIEEVAPIFGERIFGVRWAADVTKRVLSFRNTASAASPDVEVRFRDWIVDHNVLKVMTDAEFDGVYEPILHEHV